MVSGGWLTVTADIAHCVWSVIRKCSKFVIATLIYIRNKIILFTIYIDTSLYVSYYINVYELSWLDELKVARASQFRCHYNGVHDYTSI